MRGPPCVGCLVLLNLQRQFPALTETSSFVFQMRKLRPREARVHMRAVRGVGHKGALRGSQAGWRQESGTAGPQGRGGPRSRSWPFLGQRFTWRETYISGIHGHCVNQQRNHIIGELFPFLINHVTDLSLKPSHHLKQTNKKNTLVFVKHLI